MKSSNKKRSNGRHGHFGNNHHPSNVIGRNTVLESNGPAGHIRGTAAQLAEKYLAVSKDARHQGDRILSELCSQQAEHYIRVANQAMQYEMAARQEALQAEPTLPEKSDVTETTPSDEETSTNVEESVKEEAKEEPKVEKKPRRKRLFVKKKGAPEQLPQTEQPQKEE